MLLLNLKSGEYLTIGEDTYIQFFKHSSSTIRAAVHAPRDVLVLRGAVHERTGERPKGLSDTDRLPKSPSECKYDARHYEEWIKKREAREREIQHEMEERDSALRELTAIADNIEELIAENGSRTVKTKLNDVCARINALGFAQNGGSRGGRTEDER